MGLDISKKVKSLPDEPGVYFFKDNAGRIIYIGKAKSLKKRVANYFRGALDAKTLALVEKIADIEWRLCGTEAQAQIIEAALIKEYQPRYNIDLKDDKSFPWIKIAAETFPIVSICRRKKIIQGDCAQYFGPYTDVGLLRQAIKTIRHVFGFRSCRVVPAKICLYGRINLCPAPCVGKISPEEYLKIIKRIKLFLCGALDKLLAELSAEMAKASAEKRFEDAVKFRDELNILASKVSVPVYRH